MRKKQGRHGTNTAKGAGKSVQGTGKGHASSPHVTHKRAGAVITPKKSKGPLDNRGPAGPDGYGRKMKAGRKQPYAY